MCTFTNDIWRAWYNGSYTMVAKPIRALELHYQNNDSVFNNEKEPQYNETL